MNCTIPEFDPQPVTVTRLSSTATALLLLRTDLRRTTNRAAFPEVGAVVAGQLGAWTGTLTFLAADLAAAMKLADVYSFTTEGAPATLTDADPGLDGWAHYLTEDPTLVQDVVLNGVRAPWIVNVSVMFADRGQVGGGGA